MDGFLASDLVRRVAATLGVAGSVALAYVYVLLPALTVPAPATYAFYLAWVVLVVLSVAWWRSHPWRSLAVPIVALPVALAILWFGGEYLGWTA